MTLKSCGFVKKCEGFEILYGLLENGNSLYSAWHLNVFCMCLKMSACSSDLSSELDDP